MQSYKKMSGFTLIELMITVVIIGVLAAIAVPAYTEYIRQGKIPEATSNLSQGRIRMEQFYQDNRSYAGYVDAGCLAVTPAVAAGFLADTKNFAYVCASAIASGVSTYTITANGLAARGMTGYQYTINQNNVKTSTIPGAAGATCWISKKGESC